MSKNKIEYKIDNRISLLLPKGSVVSINNNVIREAQQERTYLAPREVSHEDFVNMRCEILRKQLYSKDVIAKFRKSGALKWPKLRFLVGPTPYDIGGPVIDRMPDF